MSLNILWLLIGLIVPDSTIVCHRFRLPNQGDTLVMREVCKPLSWWYAYWKPVMDAEAKRPTGLFGPDGKKVQ